MNWPAIYAIYRFEMARTRRTLLQSIVAPVISTSLYFVVFGTAIGSRIQQVGDVSYGAFIVPGLIMLSLLTHSISTASFGIYFPRFAGTIYEVLSAPVSYVEILASYVGAAATKSLILALVILGTATFFVPMRIDHPLWMVLFLVLTAITFSLFGFIIGIWADSFEKLQLVPLLIVTADLPGRQLLLHRHAAALLAKSHPAQSGGLPHQRVPLELLQHRRRQCRGQPGHDAGLPAGLPGHRGLDVQDRIPPAALSAVPRHTP